MKPRSTQGPILVMVAASLWAIDALIRTPLTKTMPAASIVLYEHIIGLLVLSPILFRSFSVIWTLSTKTWLQVLLLSLVSSVGGTVLFTQALASSFATGDFITPLLLQKLQPIIVIILAAVLLKEKLHKKFLLWAPLALTGSYMMSFGLTKPQFTFAGKELVVFLSLGAALCWGTGTILSKLLLQEYSSKHMTFLRFLAAIPIAFIVAVSLGQFMPPGLLTTNQLMRLIVISLSTGAVALLIYYAGLAKTNAHIATIAELMFPLVSILIGITQLNPYGMPQVLTPTQIVGIVLLLGSVYKISQLGQTDKKPFILKATVIKGNGEGKKLGFPTANLKFTKPLNLPYGVRACMAVIDGKRFGGVLHYGPRSTFGQTTPTLEVHVFDMKKNIYGKQMTVEIGDFIRGTKKFSSVKKLVAQMNEDCILAKRLQSINQ